MKVKLDSKRTRGLIGEWIDETNEVLISIHYTEKQRRALRKRVEELKDMLRHG